MFIAKAEEYYRLGAGFTLIEEYHIYIIKKRLKRSKTKT